MLTGTLFCILILAWIISKPAGKTTG